MGFPVLRRYQGRSLDEIVLPIGGIGTGFFGLGGRGQLSDWQLMSRPNRGWRPMYVHLLLRTKQGDDVRLRVLEGDLARGLNPYALIRLPPGRGCFIAALLTNVAAIGHQK